MAPLSVHVAIKEDPKLQDNYIKLGALLIDMDEPDEVIFKYGYLIQLFD